QTAKASKAKSLSALSKVAMTEAQQLKLVTKRSMQQTHISQPSGSGADKGTGDDNEVKDDEGDEDYEGNDGQKGNGDNDDEDDDGEEGDDDDVDQEVIRDDDKDDEEEGGDDEHEFDKDKSDNETRDEESFDPIPQTPEDSKDEGDGKEDLGLSIATLEVEDSYVTLTLVNPNGQQQSSSVSSQFVTVGNKMHKVFPLPVTEFPLPEELPTAREDSCHCQKKREATARKLTLLSMSRRNYQLKVAVTLMSSQFVTVGNKMHKVFPLPVTEFPLPEELPTAREDSCHCQKKREATARKLTLLSISTKTQFRSVFVVSQDTTTTDITSGETGTKSRRTVTLTAEDMQKKKNDVKFMDVEVEQYDLNKKFLTSLVPEWLMHTTVWRNISDLDTMTLDDLYNHLKKRTRKKISIQGSDVVGFDKSKVECFNCHKMGHFARECRAPRSQDRGRRDNFRQGSKAEEQASKALIAIDGVGWDWSYVENDGEDHALVADEEAPTEFALMARGSSQNNIDNKGYWDSGCSRHMTCNISYLFYYEPFDTGYVSFGQEGCKITGKGTIKTGKLEFENVYIVKDLKYNLFSVSQICDNKNSVLFTDSKCIVLGRDFKLLDDANVLLRTPRQHNMYSIDLNNIVPHKDLTSLVAKASADKCMLWHRRLVTDDFSRFTWTFFLKSKDETSGILKKFITKIENLKDLKVKIIRCDNGEEFRNKEMNDFVHKRESKESLAMLGLLNRI
nr:ribonuclease H-like domain-containing protein [Tanacetum cinerariifolium]